MNLTIKHFTPLHAGSNHYGIAGYYSMRAMEKGFIVSRKHCVIIIAIMIDLNIRTVSNLQGMSTTNTSPIGVPTRSKEV